MESKHIAYHFIFSCNGNLKLWDKGEKVHRQTLKNWCRQEKKNLIQRLHGRGKRVSGQGRWNTLLQLILPSELLVSETLWQARAALIYIGTTCYDTVFYSPPLLLFIIKRGSSRGLTKTIFIDSGEAYFCLMHCLYIGQQSCLSGNKHKMKRHALPVSVFFLVFWGCPQQGLD